MKPVLYKDKESLLRFARVAVFALAAVLPLFWIGATVSVRTRNMLKANILNELLLFAQDTANNIRGFLEKAEARVMDFCSDGLIKDGLTYYDPEDPGADELIKQINSHLAKNKLSLDPDMADILVLNLRGEVIFSSNEKWLGENKSAKDYFLSVSRYFNDRQALKSMRQKPSSMVYHSDIYLSDDLMVPALAVSNIVLARATGLPLGVLVNRYPGSKFNRIFEAKKYPLGKTAKTCLLNQEGLFLTSPGFYGQRKGEEAILKEKISLQHITKAFSAPHLLGIYKDFRGKDVLRAIVPLGSHHWIVLAEKDKAEAFGFLYGLMLQITAIGLITIGMAAAISILISYLQKKVQEKSFQLDAARNQMYQSAKMSAIGQMAGSVAHEINNPLTGVLNNVQLLKMEIAMAKDINPGALKSSLDIIEESALRCVKITRSLLDFSRSSKGEFKAVSLNDAADKAIVLVRNELRLKNIAVEKDFQQALPPVSGDIQLLQQAIFDIINNAKYAINKKFTREGGRILLKTAYEPDKGNVVLLISDNGTGISRENMEKLFIPFFTTKPQGEGTGLGLPFIQDIITMHKGRVSCQSKIGEGSVFKITLPFLKERQGLAEMNQQKGGDS